MASGSGSGKMEPLWAEDPEEAGSKLGALWLSRIAQIAPPSLSQQALPAFLPALLCRALSFHRCRSQPGHLFFTLTVSPALSNRYTTLHGGVIGSLVETLGCAAIRSVAKSTSWSVTDISISYIAGTPIKEEVEFEAWVLRVGKMIAVAAVDVKNKNSAKVAAQGRVTMCSNPLSKL
ncbi:hypothetical protein GOP47_0012122 [Adiantum capillus-veneris]|uniref:Thioesterase domain-containing protein n=1 Tax=Adiantum capillus-veneris TaxID=13818 RepID=A0A9D4UQU0_ADICA|nr:hypothetical protein GOP47_0012122 [Adiantum capillus-veneris]